MPKRSNDFQQLILLIERQLAQSGTTVEESAMLPDNHDGTMREVDILITTPIAGRELRIAIECRDSRRNADVPWIDYLIGRYATLPVDRCVAVSRRGFSKAALSKAKLHSIETLKLERATALSWPSVVHRVTAMEFTEVAYESGSPVTLLVTSTTGAPNWAGHSRLIPIRDAFGEVCSLQEVADVLLGQREVQQAIEHVKSEVPTGKLGIRVELGPGMSACDADGVWYPLGGVRLSVTRLATVGVAALSHTAYGATAVASGEGQLASMPFGVAITQRMGQPARGQAVFKRAGKEVVINFALPDVISGS